jgi:ECF transporter S component (folate family)
MKKQQAIYSHPFSLAYWRDAAAECKNVRSIAHAAFLCALAIVIEKFNIPISPYLQVSVSFFAVALCSMLTGPVLAIPCGILVDLIGIIGSPYPVFLGYTLTAILTSVVYALFLYRGNISYFRVLAAEVIINFLINAFLGSYWRVILYNGAFWVYFALAIAKNLVLLAPEAFLLYSFLRIFASPLKQIGILPAGVSFKSGKGSLFFSCVFAILGVVLVALFAIYYPEIKEYITTMFS